MPRVKLVLEYDGTNYVGWQIQENGPSVQGRVQRAIAELVGEPVAIVAAGRTDSGVHARGQVVAFDSPRQLPLKAYWMGLNSLLPEDIAVVRADEVADDFDPRRWSDGKRYCYLVSNRRSRTPLRRLTHWEIFLPLQVPAMVEASQHLLGRHDFSAFRASDCQAAHATRDSVSSVRSQPANWFQLAKTRDANSSIVHSLEGSAPPASRGESAVGRSVNR